MITKLTTRQLTSLFLQWNSTKNHTTQNSPIPNTTSIQLLTHSFIHETRQLEENDTVASKREPRTFFKRMARMASLSDVEVVDGEAELRRLRPAALVSAVVEVEQARKTSVRGVRRNAWEWKKCFSGFQVSVHSFSASILSFTTVSYQILFIYLSGLRWRFERLQYLNYYI